MGNLVIQVLPSLMTKTIRGHVFGDFSFYNVINPIILLPHKMFETMLGRHERSVADKIIFPVTGIWFTNDKLLPGK